METYKVIEGFENYSVSDFGNVKNNKTHRILKFNTHARGYKKVALSVNGVMFHRLAHRLVATAFIVNTEMKDCVDHIDNDTSNNHVINLRWATVSENQHNRKVNKNSSTGVKGIYFHKASQTWQPRIMSNGVYVRLGSFDTLEGAKQARIKSANEAFGVFTHSSEKTI